MYKEPIHYEGGEGAKAILDALNQIVKTFGFATVSDLKQLSGLPITYVDEQWGWASFDGVQVVKDGPGWTLSLPMPVPNPGPKKKDPRTELLKRVENDLTLHPPVAPYIGERMDALRAKAKEFAHEVVDK